MIGNTLNLHDRSRFSEDVDAMLGECTNGGARAVCPGCVERIAIPSWAGTPCRAHGRRASADAGYPTYRIPRRLVAAITTVDQR